MINIKSYKNYKKKTHWLVWKKQLTSQYFKFYSKSTRKKHMITQWTLGYEPVTRKINRNTHTMFWMYAIFARNKRSKEKQRRRNNKLRYMENIQPILLKYFSHYFEMKLHTKSKLYDNLKHNVIWKERRRGKRSKQVVSESTHSLCCSFVS